MKNVVGLVGIGLLGSALAERFLASGYTVLGFDLHPDRRSALDALGGRSTSSVSSLVSCSRIVLSLPDSTVVQQVFQTWGESLRPGTVVLDTTTGDPEEMALLGEQLAPRRINYIDTCILGSSALVRSADALVLAGGEPDQIKENEDLFRCFSRRFFSLGPCGSGARMKLVVNLVLGLNRAVLAEGLAFAQRHGFSLDTTLEILRSGAAYSRVMDSKGEKMRTRDFRPEAKLTQHLKDVQLMLRQAHRIGAIVPLSTVHAQLLQQVVALGAGDEDNSAILRAFDPPSPDPNCAPVNQLHQTTNPNPAASHLPPRDASR